ncbi:MAG: hypothetical protein ABFS23_10220 [Pseudomonadota bacterium]
MENATLVAYVATALAVLLSLTEMLQMVIGAVFGRVLGVFTSAFLGSMLVWSLVDFLWIRFEGAHITVTALGGAWLLVFLIRGLLRKKGLKEEVLAELAAIAVLGGYVVLMSSPVRWH